MRLVRTEHRGEAAARNAGIAAARGEFFRFVDADDAYEPTSTARLLQAARECPGFIPYGSTVFCDERLRPIWTMLSRRQGWVAEACLLGRFPVRVPSMLFARSTVEAAGEWDLGFNGVSHDLDWLLRTLEKAPVVGSRSPATFYRKHQSGATRDFRAGERGRRLVIDRFFERNRSRRGSRLERQAEARFYAVEARVRLTHGLYGPMFRRLGKAVRLDPGSVAWELAYGVPALTGRFRQRLRPRRGGHLF
jgi:glycosyltransferase involved in cell wall biosynthesis